MYIPACRLADWSMISITHPNEPLLKVIYGGFYTQISRFTLPHCCPNKNPLTMNNVQNNLREV